MRRLVGILFACSSIATPLPAEAPVLTAVKAVGREGQGNTSAAAAWKKLAASDVNALPEVLAAFDGANATAANWLRSAADAIVERHHAGNGKVDAALLTTFVLDVRHNPTARRLAYDYLKADHPGAASKLLPKFLKDVQPDLRREAVEQKLDGFKTLKDDKALVAAYRDTLSDARDDDQITQIARKLEELKEPVNLTKHFGFITEWTVSAPFDNKGGAGFAIAYGPETKPGRDGWKYTQSSEVMGTMDLNKAIAKQKDLVAYASATLVLDKPTTLDVRAESQNAVKIFVNGKEVLAREEYHHGAFLDQHVATVTLNAGDNEVLLKVCQNDQTQPWCEPWGFACRLSDGTGLAVRPQQRIIRDGKPVLVNLGELAASAQKKEGK